MCYSTLPSRPDEVGRVGVTQGMTPGSGLFTVAACHCQYSIVIEKAVLFADSFYSYDDAFDGYDHQ